jgi:CBS domain-containing protein
MKAKDIMTKDPSCVTPDTPLRDAAKMMQRDDVGMLPVVESKGSKKLVGVITDRDITIRHVAEGHASPDCPVREAMTERPVTSREDDDLDDVMKIMGREQVRRIPIVDERGSILGVVAQADIVRDAKDDKRAERTVEKISEPGGRHSH